MHSSTLVLEALWASKISIPLSCKQKNVTKSFSQIITGNLMVRKEALLKENSSSSFPMTEIYEKFISNCQSWWSKELRINRRQKMKIAVHWCDGFCVQAMRVASAILWWKETASICLSRYIFYRPAASVDAKLSQAERISSLAFWSAKSNFLLLPWFVERTQQRKWFGKIMDFPINVALWMMFFAKKRVR